MHQIAPAPTIATPSWLPDAHRALEESDLSPLTKRAYRDNISLFLRWLESVGQLFEKLAASDVAAYRQHLVNVARLKATTINHRLHAIRWLCRWAQRCGILASNPAAEVTALRLAKRTQPVGLKDDEVYALLRVAGQSRPALRHRNYAIVQLLVQVGLRVGEVAALRIGDATIYERRGHLLVRLGKGRKEREVPLNASARRALRLYLQTRPEVKPAEPLFLSQEGGGLSRRSLQALLRELAARAKVERVHVTAHCLRHTFAMSFLKDHPGRLVELQALLGHESLDTTTIYTRPSREDLAACLEQSRHNAYG